MRAHDLADLNDLSYVPPDADSARDFQKKQAWMFAVLLDVVRTPTGNAIVQNHKRTFDARAVLHELRLDAVTTIDSRLRLREHRRRITTVRLNADWSQSQMTFLLEFKELLRMYTELSPDASVLISSLQAKEFLEAAVYPARNLRDISLREMELMVSTQSAGYDFDQYFLCLTTAAQLHDKANKPARSTRARMADRSDADYDDDSDPEPFISAHAARSGRRPDSDHSRPPRPFLPSKAWKEISSARKVSWSAFSDPDKSVIVGSLSVNQHELTDATVAWTGPRIPPTLMKPATCLPS